MSRGALDIKPIIGLMSIMGKTPTIQLGDLCLLFDFPAREVRYLLERGFVPPGVDKSPSTGNRREFGPGAAFWLAIAVLLRRNGLNASAAAEVAGLATEGVRTISQNLSWDPGFLPLAGYFKTDHEYLLDIGDRAYVRILTDSCPSQTGLYQFGWRHLKSSSSLQLDVQPLVILRLDIRRIAEVLSRVEGWNKTRTDFLAEA